MFDINLLRNDLAATAERMKARNTVIDTVAFEALEAERKALQIQTQDLQQQRNTLSKAVGQAKAAKDEAKAQLLLAEVALVPEKVKANEAALALIQDKVNTLLMTTTSTTPSIVPATVPVPPVMRAPPSTTAAITLISMPTMSNGLASRLEHA